MHLTNYAINKSSTDFSRDDEAGSKRQVTKERISTLGTCIDMICGMTLKVFVFPAADHL